MGQSRVQVIHQPSGAALASRADVADNLWKLLVGLIPYRRLDTGEGMVLPHTGSIHTAGVRFEIDVLFLDAQKRIIGISSRVRPFRIAWAPRGTRTAIELPAGTLARAGCQPGDSVSIEPASASNGRAGPLYKKS